MCNDFNKIKNKYNKKHTYYYYYYLITYLTIKVFNYNDLMNITH